MIFYLDRSVGKYLTCLTIFIFLMHSFVLASFHKFQNALVVKAFLVFIPITFYQDIKTIKGRGKKEKRKKKYTYVL